MSATLSEYWFLFQNDSLLLCKDEQALRLPSNEYITDLKPHFLRQHSLGQYNKIIYYCAELDPTTKFPPNMPLVPLRKAFEILGNELYGLLSKAYSIINWDKNHKFCGRCGKLTIHKPETFERICESCGLSNYPRISPSIIVLIKKDDEILMARSPHFTPGAYGLIAGFVEAGESIEEAVHREVREEVGIKIKNLHYFGSQSWPFPDSLMIGFIADYDSGELNINYNELESAGWYKIDNLPGRPSISISIAKKIIDYFVESQKGNS